MYKITAGDTFSFAGPIMDMDTNLPYSLTGLTVSSEIYKFAGDNVNPTVKDKLADATTLVLDAPAGQVSIKCATGVTALWPAGLAVVKLIIVNGLEQFSTYSQPFMVAK
jgi:hypothetical protein